MILALDYDNTFTLDPELWMSVLAQFEDSQYKVIIATGRKGWSEDMECHRSQLETFDDVIFCGNEYKQTVCKLCGYDVDVWIDDTPCTIQPTLNEVKDTEL